MDPSPLMKREKVEHILRAAGEVTRRARFVLIGSAAIVAWREIVPPELAMSRDIDLFAYDAPDADDVSSELDGSLGQASAFDDAFGYYCDGVGPETAILLDDWLACAIEFTTPETGGVVAIVPEPNDIALSKLVAWRPKDIDWLQAATRHGIIVPSVMLDRVDRMPDKDVSRAVMEQRIASLLVR